MEKKIVIASFTVIFLTIITGCHREFSRLNKGHSKAEKFYSYSDSLVIKNYVLYNSQAHANLTHNSLPIPINEDSVMQVIWKSFDKLDLPIISQLEKGKNHNDSTFYKDYLIRIRKIDKEWIKEVAGESNDILVLVPVISILNKIGFTGFISSGGMAGSRGFIMNSFINLVVFIVHNNEVIYIRQIRHSSERTWADSRAEAEAIPPAPLVTQEHWDELVRLAMKDYIKRLR
ncbi:MAG: hypothetical protein JJU28_09395 [Cyclobacteriaceae bacterium]|nr:hypothetical protein [Cyclobacteriaceae bacterium]